MLKIRAKQKVLTVGSNKGKACFVMSPVHYAALTPEKVFTEAALRTGLPKATIQAAWTGIGELVEAWLCEGHRVPIPGMGNVRVGINAKTVVDVEDVKANLITRRKVVFTPSAHIKRTLRNTEISITCYDQDGQVVTP